MALRHESGAVGELAKTAFHNLMNPKAVIAEDISALQSKPGANAKKAAGP